MSKRDWVLLFEDILESIYKIENYTKELSFNDFADNTLVIDGVIRNIEIIGEASKNIPLEIQEQFSDIPMEKIERYKEQNYSRVL